MAETRDASTERKLRDLASSLRSTAQELRRTGDLPSEEVIRRIQEWQATVNRLAGTVAKDSELAALHDLNRVLNSSLDLADTLDLVMETLIRLTGAERGCLMLQSEGDELVIEAARNFDQESVEASDLEVSHTVVEQAIETGEPVLTTNALLDPRFSGEASIIGYHLRSIVCVPLKARGRVIGALYMDNHIQEGVFSGDDLPTLTTFANQAAIAIENARLYTETDQALAARVDELTTLQRIDRDLNKSLDFDRVLDLTLSWALEGTTADTGVLCIPLADGEMHVARASRDDREPADPDPREIELAMQSSEPIHIGRLRLLVPIRVERRTIGFVDLRSLGRPGFAEEQQRFASRLYTRSFGAPTPPSRSSSPSSPMSSAPPSPLFWATRRSWPTAPPAPSRRNRSSLSRPSRTTSIAWSSWSPTSRTSPASSRDSSRWSSSMPPWSTSSRELPRPSARRSSVTGRLSSSTCPRSSLW
jgi:putative methionine-R-sulfoxide reductase with GAF domain